MIEPIIADMKRLVKLHRSLLSVSKEKTEVLKANDTAKLQQLDLEEKKHIQAVQKVEKGRQAHVNDWYAHQGAEPAEQTISDMLTYLEGEEYEQLNEEYEAMILILADLKYQERLNGELTKQSLQFINLSLDLLAPGIGNLNYGSEEKPAHSNRSIFDSKA